MSSSRTALVCQSCNAQIDGPVPEHAPLAGWRRLSILLGPPTDEVGVGAVVYDAEARELPQLVPSAIREEIRSMVLCPRCACLVRVLYG